MILNQMGIFISSLTRGAASSALRIITDSGVWSNAGYQGSAAIRHVTNRVNPIYVNQSTWPLAHCPTLAEVRHFLMFLQASFLMNREWLNTHLAQEVP